MDPVITPTTSGAIAGLISLITANIDNPTELNAVGTAVEDLRLVHESVAGSDRATLYRLDTSSDGVSAPFIMASATAGLRWVAISGYACNQAVKIANALTVLDATDHAKIITWTLSSMGTGATLTLRPTSTTSQILQYPDITGTDTLVTLGLAQTISAVKTFSAQWASTVTTGTAPFTVASTTQVANLNASQLIGGTWAIPGAIGATTPSSGAFTTITASSGTGSTSPTTGAVVITGGLGIGAGFVCGGDCNIQRSTATATFYIQNASSGTTSSDGMFLQATATVANMGTFENVPLQFWSNSQNRGAFAATGEFSVASTTDATALGTAGVVATGGASIAKTLIHAKGRGAGVTSNATLAGTITLTATSAEIQTFTGSTAGTVVQFPAANLRGAGIAVLFTINNQSTQTVTPTRAGADTFQGGGTTDPVVAGATTRYASDGVSVWLKV